MSSVKRLEPPHDFDAEQSLLGALLLNNDAAERVRDIVKAEHFADPLHGELFEVVLRMVDRGLIANLMSLRTWFDSHGKAAEVKPDYLARLAAASVHAGNVRQCADTVLRHWQRRRIQAVAGQLLECASNDDGEIDIEGAVQGFASTLDDVVQRAERGSGFMPIRRGMATAIGTVENAFRRDRNLAGLSTGFAKIDDIVGGFNRSDLVILAARPTVGKTALATNIAVNNALTHKVDENGATVDGAVVGFFSLEMSAEQLSLRIIGDRAGISASRLRRGDIGSADFDKVMAATMELETLPLYIDDAGGLTLDQIRARARRLKRQHGLGLLVVDYLQLVVGPERRRENRVQEVTAISGGLKALAKELDVPVLALSQLSRDVEKRTDKRPQLADLRDSGAIEQDADCVLFIFRPDLHPDTDKHAVEKVRDMGRAEIIVAKNRHGPTGTAELHFDGRFTRFTSHGE